MANARRKLIEAKKAGYGEQMIPLKFTAVTAGATVKLSNVAGSYAISYDMNTWSNYTLGNSIKLANKGSYVYFAARTTNTTTYKSSGGSRTSTHFSFTGTIDASGNIMSLLDKTMSKTAASGRQSFYRLFYNCTTLRTAPEIWCMTATGSQSFYQMFYGCSALQYIKVHWTSWPSGSNMTYNWLQRTASSGYFVCPAGLSQTKGNSYIPSGWTVKTFNE